MELTSNHATNPNKATLYYFNQDKGAYVGVDVTEVLEEKPPMHDDAWAGVEYCRGGIRCLVPFFTRKNIDNIVGRLNQILDVVIVNEKQKNATQELMRRAAWEEFNVQCDSALGAVKYCECPPKCYSSDDDCSC